MIKIEHVVLPSPEQMIFVIEGMRNAYNSWDKSDSYKTKVVDEATMQEADFEVFVGDNDLDRMMGLCNSGTDHRKYMRMQPVYVRITAPLYWWKEFDTYKVGTVANSCSTMHTIMAKEFDISDFSIEHLVSGWEVEMMEGISSTEPGPLELTYVTIDILNKIRDKYIKLKNESVDAQTLKDCWWQIIQLLPSSYNQMRNVMVNYEVLNKMYNSRKSHKLDEWRELCKWMETLPYSELITGESK